MFQKLLTNEYDKYYEEPHLGNQNKRRYFIYIFMSQKKMK